MRRVITTRASWLLAVGPFLLLACSDATGPESFEPPLFGFGNGAPNGAHYNLNMIGVPKEKSADMTNNNGHRIFVKLEGKTKISLCESGADGVCSDVSGFRVLDANGTDGSAKFALPAVEDDTPGQSVYSVYVRALGTPGGGATNTTCGMGAGLDEVLGTDDDEEVCSVVQLALSRTKGRSRFDNVTREMLYVYADVDLDGDLDRVPLFDDSLIGYFWDYDNQGLKLAQFRFYPCSTTVPGPDDPDGEIVTDCTL